MKTSKKIISLVLAVLIVASAMAVCAVSASAATLKAPKGLKVVNGIHGFGISWKPVSGAKKYQLYKGGKFLRNVANTKTADFSIEGGITYTYKVRAINGKKTSKFSATVKIVRVNKTIITSLSNTAAGVKIKWANRPGSDKYIVERKTTGAFTKLGTTTKTVRSFVDKTAVAGTKYIYRITCYNAATKAYSSVSNVATIVRLVAPTNFKAKKTVERKITLEWTSAKGAESYDIYRQNATETSYKLLKNVTTTSYTDSDIKDNPSAYRYYVVSRKSSYSSAKCAERVVQTYGKNHAYLDEQGNYHIPLTIAAGDTYEEGKYLVDYFSYDGTYDINIEEGSDVVTINDDNTIIKANADKAGSTAKVAIKVTQAVKNSVDNEIQDGLIIKLTNFTVYLEITVV